MKQRQADPYEFKTSLVYTVSQASQGYRVRPCLNNEVCAGGIILSIFSKWLIVNIVYMYLLHINLILYLLQISPEKGKRLVDER